MPQKRLGIVTIGQTPRPDLISPLANLAARCDLEIRGALDGLSLTAIDELVSVQPKDPNARYPLVTTLSSGAVITVDESALSPLVQKRIDELDEAGVEASLLLCAGPFESLTSTSPLLRPFDIAVKTLRAMGISRLASVVPTNGQIDPSRIKWEAAGFAVSIWSLPDVPPRTSVEDWLQNMYSMATAIHTVECIVFDYVGYPAEVLARARKRVDVSIVDLGDLAVGVTESLLP